MFTASLEARISPPANFRSPLTTRSVENVEIPITLIPLFPTTKPVASLYVKLASSVKAPLVPARTILPEVRSDTVADPKVASPPETSNPPLASIVPVNVDTPVTDRSSSIVTVPAEESRVSPPVVVSISLSVESAILMLSIVAPPLPLASISPLNVDTPITFNVDEETFPATSRFPFASIKPSKVDMPVTSILPLTTTESPYVETPVTFNSFNVAPPTTSSPPFASIDPVKVETPETVNESISAVPFKYKSFHCFEDEPKL